MFKKKKLKKFSGKKKKGNRIKDSGEAYHINQFTDVLI